MNNKAEKIREIPVSIAVREQQEPMVFLGVRFADKEEIPVAEAARSGVDLPLSKDLLPVAKALKIQKARKTTDDSVLTLCQAIQNPASSPNRVFEATRALIEKLNEQETLLGAIPRHVEAMLEILKKTAEKPNLEASDLVEAVKKAIDIGAKAARTRPSYCFGFFKPRNDKTQSVYNAFAEAKAFKNRASFALRERMHFQKQATP